MIAQACLAAFVLGLVQCLRPQKGDEFVFGLVDVQKNVLNAMNDSIYHNLKKTAQQTTSEKLDLAEKTWKVIQNELCKIDKLDKISADFRAVEKEREKLEANYMRDEPIWHTTLTLEMHEPLMKYKKEKMDPKREVKKQLEAECADLNNRLDRALQLQPGNDALEKKKKDLQRRLEKKEDEIDKCTKELWDMDEKEYQPLKEKKLAAVEAYSNFHNQYRLHNDLYRNEENRLLDLFNHAVEDTAQVMLINIVARMTEIMEMESKDDADRCPTGATKFHLFGKTLRRLSFMLHNNVQGDHQPHLFWYELCVDEKTKRKWGTR